MKLENLPPQAEATVHVVDRFDGRRRAGSVVGTRTPSGALRRGIDRERVIGIDNGALRIQPLLDPGWGKAGLAYGPFTRHNGLAFAVFAVNGHNTSQSENLAETFGKRFERWFIGPGLFRRRERLLQWLLSTRKRRTLRQWRWWRRIAKDAPAVARHDENLAIGWFAHPVPSDPRTEGSAFVMHATGPENGELWARVGTGHLPTVRSVQNLPIHYLIVLRERGAAYYAASVPGANGLASYPHVRPLAIDPYESAPQVYAALYQATLGQIGFRLDTRVYGARVATIPEWSNWYGSAHAADRLEGAGPLEGSAAEAGACWREVSGSLCRTPNGAVCGDAGGAAALLAPAPSGLVHLMIACAADVQGSVCIDWRRVDADNHWRLRIDTHSCELEVREGAAVTALARTGDVGLRPDTVHSVQVLDDGRRIGVHLDGRLMFDRRFDDARLEYGRELAIGISGNAGSIALRSFEAHPRHCALPGVLAQGQPWYRLGSRVVVADDFGGAARDLDGKPTTSGGKVWRRSIGSGHIDLTGDGAARIRASALQPNPGRLAYTIDWDEPEFADLDVEITPPGVGPGQREHGLCGFILWQDPRNYVTINIWRYETYAGSSISTFFQLDGFEDLYDAIWANVGHRIYWGKPHRFRMVFDGMNFMAFVDEEPVLYRALTDVYPDAKRLQIRRVGLLANWEWGNDTGSVFRDFRARV